MNKPDTFKWVKFAGEVQADVIAADASDPGSPIGDHDVRRATLHTRQDMVLLATHLAFLNAQAELLERKMLWVVRLLWAIVTLLTVIAIHIVT